MSLLTLVQACEDHKRSLELKLIASVNRRENLDRMAKEAFENIERRADEDKKTLVELFLNLQANEEEIIAIIKEELGHKNVAQMEEPPEQSEQPEEQGVVMTLPSLRFGSKAKLPPRLRK